MIDISDGWRSDLGHICEASCVRAIVERVVPASEAMREAGLYLERSIEKWRLGPSDDYEILFTVPATRWDDAEQALHSAGTSVTLIGTIQDGEPGVQLDFAHSEIPPGWDHFTSH